MAKSVGENMVIFDVNSHYGKSNLDFVDCIFYSYHEIEGLDIAIFDKKFLKLLKDNDV